MKKIAILQSNYIPWKGYYDLIAAVDEFVLYDDAQFTKNDWRNRNLVKTPKGTEWISVPVGQNINRRIRDVTFRDHRWQEKHWKMLVTNYSKAPYFREYSVQLEPLYRDTAYQSLSQLNRAFIEVVCTCLQIRTKITNSWDYILGEGKNERILNICQQSDASQYLSGPAARAYLNENMFEAAGVTVKWFDYSNYPEYPQLWGRFEHGVSILDLLFNCGPSAHQYMKYDPGGLY